MTTKSPNAVSGAADLTDEQIMTIWSVCNQPSEANDYTTGPLPFARAVIAALNASPSVGVPDSAAIAPSAPTETALQSRIAELEAELAPYKEAEAASILRAQRRDRAESIANALFPRYDSVYARRHPDEKPPQWHEKSWWWNGVSVDFDESDIYDAYGTASLSLSSYVGGGETDTTVVKFPAQWLGADSLSEPIAAFIAEKSKERAAVKAAAEAVEAQRQIDAAKATLRRLTGDQA